MTLSITALRALLAAGTPGPWRVHDSHGLNVGAARTMVADMSPAMTAHPWEGRHEDAALIAAAHEALPELLDELERLRVEAARIEGERHTASMASIADELACGLATLKLTEAITERDAARKFGEDMAALVHADIERLFAAETERDELRDRVTEMRALVEEACKLGEKAITEALHYSKNGACLSG